MTTETYIPPAERKSGLARDWTVGACRVRVTWKKGGARCDACEQAKRGHWVVFAHIGDHPDQFDGSGQFCDECRAPHSTVPDLDYTRRHYDGDTRISEVEHLGAVAGPCGICGAGGVSEFSLFCDECDDPAHWTTSTSRVFSLDGPERTETNRYHLGHNIGEWVRCREHHDDVF